MTGYFLNSLDSGVVYPVVFYDNIHKIIFRPNAVANIYLIRHSFIFM